MSCPGGSSEGSATSSPGQFHLCLCGKPIVLFNDGACEYEGEVAVLTCGAGLYLPVTKQMYYFGRHVNTALTLEWDSDGRKQIVTEYKLVPGLLARLCWKQYFHGSCLVVYVYSEQAKYSLLSGHSDTPWSDLLAHATCFEDCYLKVWQCSRWYPATHKLHRRPFSAQLARISEKPFLSPL